MCNKIAISLNSKYEYELIFVDDNSPDATYEEINNLMQKYPMIHLIKRKGKLGLGSAVREGFNKASGDYWIMMDADLKLFNMDSKKIKYIGFWNRSFGSRTICFNRLFTIFKIIKEKKFYILCFG